jgi:hypothetical protein
VLDTFEITSKPMNTDSTKMVNSPTVVSVISGPRRCA